MTIKAGYWVVLLSIKLDDGDSPSTWIQAMPIGD